MSTATTTIKSSGRSTRNAMSHSATKRSSRSATPIQDVEKTPIKNNTQPEKSNKVAVIEETIKEEKSPEACEKSVTPSKASKKMIEDEKTPSKSPKKPEEEKLQEIVVTSETSQEEKTNGVETEGKTNGIEKEKDKEESTSEVDAKTNGTEEKCENGVPTEEACIKNGDSNSEESSEMVVDEEDKEKPSTVEIMDEPMLTLSEDDEKSSLHDSFDVECTFESSSPTFSPKGNRSVTRRSQAKTIPTPETPKAIPLDNILEKASTSNGASEDEFIVVDDSEKESNAGTDIIVDDVSSTEMQDVTLPSRNSPFRRSPRLVENTSLIANYSGSTTRDLSMDENSSNGNDSNDDSLNTTRETIGEPSPNYGRSLRSITGRKSMRPLRELSFRNAKRQIDASKLKNSENNDTQTSMNVTVGTDLNSSIGSRDANKSLKRERSATPVDQGSDNKKFKSEASTADFIMNYIPSPMTALRRRFYGSRISCSTPKKQDSTKPAEVKTESTSSDDSNNPEQSNQVALINGEAKNSWCSIM